MRTRLTLDEHTQMLPWLQQGIGLTEIGRRLGRPRSNLEATRRRLVRDGIIPMRPRAPWRVWTGPDRDKLAELIDAGYSYDAIARKLGRTRTSVILEARRRYVRITTTPATMSARDVAALLGIGCSKAVSRWIRRGWLRARNAGQKDRPLWRITHEALWAFMENPNTWMAWNTARITDPALREWAQELRANESRWLSMGAVAERYHVGTGAVQQWIAKGWLPAARYGNHYINERDLVGWVPPCDRPRTTWVHPPRNWPRDGWHTVGCIGGVTLYRRAA